MSSVRSSVANAQTNVCEVSRLEWLSILKSIPKQEDPVVAVMVADHLLGATTAGTPVVYVETWQAKAILKLAPAESSSVQSGGGESEGDHS